jgi:hypothetical protein
MAKAADDGARDAREEGEAFREKIQAVEASGAEAGPIEALHSEAEAAIRALVAYERQAQAAASEAFHLLAESARAGAATPPDLPRRQVFEERALLAAHEAAVMAARARAEAERLRAIHAEVRVLLAGSSPGGGGEAPPGASDGPAVSGREVTTPNLVGARLDAARRDLATAGLRLGTVRGPPDGYVVDQDPAPGARVPRLTAVQLTLSATAVRVETLAPR